jgi:sigma-B regulation protein RsbU (phosphoserine phosphatase)
MNKPSKHVGGDYYDLVALSDTRVGIAIADVSGKGVPAALLMACLQSSLRGEADASKAPRQVISALNQVIYEHTFGGTFVTIFYAVLDFNTGMLTYCNAGQTPPLILGSDLSFKTLDETDIVIGIEPEAEYRDTTVKIRPGDLILLYTDGITDELDDNDEPYGEARLMEEVKRCYALGLQEILNRIHEAILKHTGGKPQDDLTALAVRVEAIPHPITRSTSGSQESLK